MGYDLSLYTVSELDGRSLTALSALRLACSNCHQACCPSKSSGRYCSGRANPESCIWEHQLPREGERSRSH